MKEVLFDDQLVPVDEVFDIRCSGCPAILAREIGRASLASGSCGNGRSYTDDLSEQGCSKGQPNGLPISKPWYDVELSTY